MTRDEAFAAWLRKPADCKTVIYHNGRLPADRMIDPALDRLANSALAAAIEGVIVLVQKRTSEGSYEYRAIHAAVAA